MYAKSPTRPEARAIETIVIWMIDLNERSLGVEPISALGFGRFSELVSMIKKIGHIYNTVPRVVYEVVQYVYD
jgi:hypothetical protein